MLANQSLTEVLNAFSSSAPTPGGGSAAALAGALGASLLAMVAGLPKTKSNTPEERATLDAARARILDLQARLVGLIDRDAAAYDAVVAAYRLPKSSDDEKAARKAAVQDAMELATRVPLETCETVNDVMRQAGDVAAAGNPSARTDIAVGMLLLGQAAQGALFNIEANIGSVTDQRFTNEVAQRVKDAYAGAPVFVGRAYRAANLIDLFKAVAARFELPHGHPDSGETPPTDVWLRTAVESLRRAGTEDAKRSLDVLAAGSDEKVAELARAALAKFTSPD